MFQILGLFFLGIGALIVFGGYQGIRTGKMQKVQFGNNAATPAPVTLEGAAARNQAIGYIIVGGLLALFGLLMLVNVPNIFPLFLGMMSLIGGIFFAYYGVQGIRQRQITFSITVGRRGLIYSTRRVRYISRHYTETSALNVGVGYIILGLSLIALGLIFILSFESILTGVIIFAVGFVLFVLIAFISKSLPAESA